MPKQEINVTVSWNLFEYIPSLRDTLSEEELNLQREEFRQRFEDFIRNDEQSPYFGKVVKYYHSEPQVPSRAYHVHYSADTKTIDDWRDLPCFQRTSNQAIDFAYDGGNKWVLLFYRDPAHPYADALSDHIILEAELHLK